MESLFTNLHLDETIKISIDRFFKFKMTVSSLNKEEMFEMLPLTLKNLSFCLITNIAVKLTELPRVLLYDQHCLIFFLFYHESNWLKHLPKDFKPVYYKRHVDDIYVLFNKLEHAQLFLEFINKNYKNQLRLTYFKKMKSLSLVF